MNIIYTNAHVKCYFCPILIKIGTSTQTNKKQTSVVGFALFEADRRTDTARLTVDFSNHSGNAPKIKKQIKMPIN